MSVPQMVKGELVWPEPPSRRALDEAAVSSSRPVLRVGDTWAMRRAVLDPGTAEPTGEVSWLVFARPAPRSLVESDPAALARTLHARPFSEVLAFAAALRDVLAGSRATLAAGVASLDGASVVDPRLASAMLDVLPALLDPDALGAALDRDLGMDGVPGRAFLDGWVDVAGPAHRGMTSRIAESIGAWPRPRGAFVPAVRAVPTRQLHITAGNSPIVPFLSFLRGLLTRGACTIKSPSEAIGMGTLLGAAVRAALGPDHPIARHTSFVYWPGGDPSMEDVLLGPGAYDRVVVWGTAETVRSVRERAVHARTVVMAPRYGVSLIGREAQEDVETVAELAGIDTLVWEQRACTSSLVHYVEGGDAEAQAWAAAVQRALGRWDERRPRPLPRAQVGRMRLLRRGPLVRGTWFENGAGAELRSAVVVVREPFDLALHPMSRFVVVRAVETLDAALRWISPAVSTAGVFPTAALVGIRDALAAAGVSNVFPLGEAERSWAGMPHDGMRILSELVSWTSSGVVSEAEEGDE